MPISEYFHGNGNEVMANMQHEYGGGKKAKSVFYALANKQHDAKPMAQGGLVTEPWWQRQQQPNEMPPPPGTEQAPPQTPQPLSRFDMPEQPVARAMPDMPEPESQGVPTQLAGGMPDAPGPGYRMMAARTAEPTPAPTPAPSPIAPAPQPEASSSADMGQPIGRPAAAEAAPAPATPAEDPRIAAGKEMAAEIMKRARVQTPAWRQALAAALTLSPRTAGIAPMLLHPPNNMERLAPIIEKNAAEARLEKAEASNEVLKHEQIEGTKEWRLAGVAQRAAAQKGAPLTPSERQLLLSQHPEIAALLNKQETKEYIINGTLKEKGAPTIFKQGEAVEDPNSPGHFITPVPAQPKLQSVAQGASLVDPAHPEKPVFTNPGKEVADKEDINHWIAAVRNPESTPEQVALAHSKITDWQKTQKEQRAPVINVNATPSDPAIEQAAVRYLKTGELPSLGMGRDAASARTKILNRAAELDPNADIASNKGGYGADKASLVSLQKTADAVNAFEGLARKNLDRFTDVAQRTVDSGQPWANRVFRGGARVLGDKSAAEFEAARVTAFTEVAKVLNNPTSSAVLSDSARKEAESVLSGSYTIPQLMAVANLLKKEMGDRKGENQRAIKEIQARMKGGKKEESGGGGAVVKWGRDAQGNPVQLSQ